MVTNIRHHTAERHSKLWRGWSYIMTHKWAGTTSRNLKEFRFIYSVKSIKEWNQSWSATLWIMKHQPYTPNMSHPEYCTCSDVKCFSRIWSSRNGVERTSLVKSMIEVMKIPLDSYEEHVGKISAAFLRPTRHRVVQTTQDWILCTSSARWCYTFVQPNLCHRGVPLGVNDSQTAKRCPYCMFHFKFSCFINRPECQPAASVRQISPQKFDSALRSTSRTFVADLKTAEPLRPHSCTLGT